MSKKSKVLFLCRDNSACSLIAEALLRELGGHRFDAFSAGREPAARIHPLALAQLRSGFSARDALGPKSWLEFTGEWAPCMDLVITLDESVGPRDAPAFPGAPALLVWNIVDPLADGVCEAERVRLFDKMFWQLVRQVSALIAAPRFTAPAGCARAGRAGLSCVAASDVGRAGNGSIARSPAARAAIVSQNLTSTYDA